VTYESENTDVTIVNEISKNTKVFPSVIGPRGHGMTRAITLVQTGYDDPRFGTPGHTWDELAAVITNLPPLLSLMSRILRGLLGLKGPVYKLIRHLPPCAVLEALSLIAEEYNYLNSRNIPGIKYRAGHIAEKKRVCGPKRR
jgi:hypothetical protein